MSDWIDINDKLPEISENENTFYLLSELVLVFNGYKQRLARVVFDKEDNIYSWRSDCSESWDIPSVTHWKYLSDNPK